MLGIIVSGRLVQTDFQQISENQFLINVADADNVNHIVIFLTGTIPFPDGMGGAVYFSWPDPNAPPNWQFLGYISNVKPSAIFKISNLKKNHEFENSNLGIFGIGKISHVAQIGISVEPLSVIEPQAANLVTEKANEFLKFGQKMIMNFLNYISSFSVTQAQMVPNPTENFVPLSSVQGWYETFERRLQQNPNFWKQS
ncbi:protein OPI10 homolog [Chelonus insularis]|uniref:protein OPI10 homolog n=1 Tax=Chelonus insularis TaxID=460826 RepID=UPI00158F4F83|nr:protein OPI10 homolog [Chelonus insularis]